MDTEKTLNPIIKEKRLYKSTLRFSNVQFPNGHVAHFKAGFYATDDPTQIKYLDEEINKNGFGGVIFIDPGAKTITAEQENPMKALRERFFAEFKAEQERQLNPTNDMGSSDSGKLNPASTTDIAPVALGGDGAASIRAAIANRTSK